MYRPGMPRPRSSFERTMRARDRLDESPDDMHAVIASVLRVLVRLRVVRSKTKLRKAVRADLGSVRDSDVDAAVELLGRAVVRGEGSRGATTYKLDEDALSYDWRELLPKGAR